MSFVRFAEGSGGQELSASPACVRAIDAYLSIGRAADQLSKALDGLTQPGSYQKLDDEDSLVIVLRDFLPTDDGHDSGKKDEIGG
jgi:hypothetical protein